MLHRLARTGVPARPFVAGVVTCATLLVPCTTAFAASGQITGTVTDGAAPTHPGIGGITVDVYATSAAGGQSAPTASTTTASNGTYTVSGLASDFYVVQFRPGAQNYLPESYNGRPPGQTGDLVSVTDGQTTPSIDAALQPGGEIKGFVSPAGGGEGIQGVQVTLLDSNGDGVGQPTTTDPSGNFDIRQLPTGAYYVGFTSGPGQNYVGEYYDGSANGTQSFLSATPVSVTQGQATQGINAGMQIGGEITGTVTDATTGQPLEGVFVSANSGPWGGGATTDQNGVYTISGIATGNYTVGFRPGRTQNYVGECYGAPSCTSVSVTQGQTTGPINGALHHGARITGYVSDAQTHAPLPQTDVTLYDTQGNDIRHVTSGRNGLYSFIALPPGHYRVGFSNSGPYRYIDQFYNGKTDVAHATSINLAAGQSKSNVDAAMRLVQRRLTVSLAGSGTGGSVTGGGIHCPGTCSKTLGDGTFLTLVAHRGRSSYFAGWSGACTGTGNCPVSMFQDQSVTADFEPLPVAVVTGKKGKKPHRAVSFSFVARNVEALGYECMLVKKNPPPKDPTKTHFSKCTSPKTYKELAPGKYVFSVRAFSSHGRGPAATKRFRIK